MNLYTKILATVLLTLTVCVLSVALLFHVVFTRIIDGSRIQMMTEAPAHLDALPVYYDEILTFDLPRVAGFSNLEYIVATSNGYVIDASGQLCEHDEEYEECLSRKDIYMVPIYIEDLDEVGLFAAEVESVDETHERSVFFLGLGLILLIVTLGVLPLTRLLTQPLTRLREVVERFASGNLSARVKPDGPEEIRALAQTFNAMADSLERNIKGHKELTANVSHELRSPLARMRLIQEILADRMGTVGDNGDKD